MRFWVIQQVRGPSPEDREFFQGIVDSKAVWGPRLTNETKIFPNRTAAYNAAEALGRDVFEARVQVDVAGFRLREVGRETVLTAEGPVQAR